MNNIPTNVITGFLGVGKSTAILNLLQQKPADERWAVLVNEFGEVGVDGSLMQGQQVDPAGVFIREVPGGCMCCAAGVPMQIALTALLASAKPHRLLIEPTGLGHPREVLSVLTAKHFRSVLDLQATITLVDARHLVDSRYTSHATFNEQLAVADVIVANKADQYQAETFPALLDYLEQSDGPAGKAVFQAQFGALKLEWLQAPSSAGRGTEGVLHAHAHPDHTVSAMPLSSANTPEIPECGYVRVDNEGEGFFSRGWIFSRDRLFNAQKLSVLLTGADAIRIKAVVATDRGVIAYNKIDGVLSELLLSSCLDSRIECISDDSASLERLQPALMDCLAEGQAVNRKQEIVRDAVQ